MPEVSRFYGIIIRFYYREHPPTHFHAIYGEFEAQIEIESGAINRGRLPRTAYNLVNTSASAFICRSCAKTGIGRGSNCPYLPIQPLE